MVTCSSKKEATAIVNLLLKNRLIACANIITGLESKFWWKGRIERGGEVLVILKARADKFAKIEKEIKRIHSYEVPEIIALPIIAGSKKYLDWINSSSK